MVFNRLRSLRTRLSIVGQVGNRLATCGRLGIGLSPRPTNLRWAARWRATRTDPVKALRN
jgi:hypothetical protein